MKCQTFCMLLALVPLMAKQLNTLLQYEGEQMKNGEDGPETVATVATDPLFTRVTPKEEVPYDNRQTAVSFVGGTKEKQENSRSGTLRLKPTNPPLEETSKTNTAGNNGITFEKIFETYSSKANGTVKAFSYCLYGENGRYWKGMVNIVKAVPKYFPDWQIWLYHDSTVPHHALEKMRTMYQPSEFVVKLINVEMNFPPEVHGWNPMTWRFLIASDPEVAVYALRDSDALPTERDARIMDEWLLSGKDFHFIRDHPAHDPFTFAPILGGMWSGHRRSVPHLIQLLQEYYYPKTDRSKRNDRKSFQYGDDQDFLWSYIMPLAYNNVLQHDSYYCRESNSIAFPPLPGERIPVNFTATTMTHEDAMIALNANNHSRFAFVGNVYAKTNFIAHNKFLTAKPVRERYIQCLQDRQALEDKLFKQQQLKHLGSRNTNNQMSPAEYFARRVNTTFVGEIQGRSTSIMMKAFRDRNEKEKQR